MGKMLDLSEVKELIDSVVCHNDKNQGLAILCRSAGAQDAIRDYLTGLDGARRINALLVAGASRYFSKDDGSIIPGISGKEQLLADGSKCNASKYLAARVGEYDNPEFKFLFDFNYVLPSPDMLGVSRYIAKSVCKLLIVVAPAVPDKWQDALFGSFNVVECG